MRQNSEKTDPDADTQNDNLVISSVLKFKVNHI